MYYFVYYVQIVCDKKKKKTYQQTYLYNIYIPVLLLCECNKNKSIVYRRAVITSS